MDKKMLIEYRSKKEEIAELRNKLNNLEKNKTEELICSDVIIDYKKGYPIPQTITGIDPARVSRLRSRYITSIMKMQAECEEVEEYIDKISDSVVRRIVRMYIVEGMRQMQIAHKIHLDQSVVSRKINKFIDGVSNDK